MPEGSAAGSLGAITSGGATPLLGELPGDSWAALGSPKLGQTIKAVYQQAAGALGGAAVEQQLRSQLGIDLQEDVFSWIGDAAFFARGTTMDSIEGGAVIEVTDPAKAKAAFGKLVGLAQSRGGAPAKPIRIEGAETAFEAALPGAPKSIVAARSEDRVVIAYGREAAADALSPTDKLGDSDTYSEAKSVLGGDVEPGFLISIPAVVELASAASGGDPEFEKAKPYLEAFSVLAGGSSRDGDPARSSFAAGLKPDPPMIRVRLGVVGRVRVDRPRFLVVDHLDRGQSALANGHGGETPRGSVDQGSSKGREQRRGDEQHHRGHEQQRDDELDLRGGPGGRLRRGLSAAGAGLGRLGGERGSEWGAVAVGAAQRGRRAAAIPCAGQRRSSSSSAAAAGTPSAARPAARRSSAASRPGWRRPTSASARRGASPAATATRSRSSTSASSASIARARARARRRSHSVRGEERRGGRREHERRAEPAGRVGRERGARRQARRRGAGLDGHRVGDRDVQARRGEAGASEPGARRPAPRPSPRAGRPRATAGRPRPRRRERRPRARGGESREPPSRAGRGRRRRAGR